MGNGWQGLLSRVWKKRTRKPGSIALDPEYLAKLIRGSSNRGDRKLPHWFVSMFIDDVHGKSLGTWKDIAVRGDYGKFGNQLLLGSRRPQDHQQKEIYTRDGWRGSLVGLGLMRSNSSPYGVPLVV